VKISHALSAFMNLRCTSRTKEATALLNTSGSVTGDDRNRHNEYTHTTQFRYAGLFKSADLPWSLASV
jgi:hypothetical protein